AAHRHEHHIVPALGLAAHFAALEHDPIRQRADRRHPLVHSRTRLCLATSTSNPDGTTAPEPATITASRCSNQYPTSTSSAWRISPGTASGVVPNPAT